MADAQTIHLSLVSHTNVGKTTLARTLLRLDIGEVRDQPHVTDMAEARPLIESARGDVLMLWDPQGFGDSARLLKRLRQSANPLGWLLSQVWDRMVDRPFYSSQQAIRAARERSDVVLYLVNAAEEPASAGYVRPEMQILDWLGKPVLVLLNQTGPQRTGEAEAADIAAWQTHVADFPCVRGVLALDAFMRCWVQEDLLLGAVEPLLAGDKAEAFRRLREAWRIRNLDIFEASATVLAQQLAALAVDRESLPETTLAQRAGRWLEALLSKRESGEPEVDRAMSALALRLDAGVREATDRLIALHGLAGHAAKEIHARMAAQFRLSRPADVGKSGVLGGLATGALGGLTADLAAGGLTFGAGALIGGLLGAMGAGGAAHAYNLARGTEQGEVAWSADFLNERVGSALLRYLAVAHFGRGRGEWAAGEYPQHWQPLVREILAEYGEALAAVWEAARHAARDGVEAALRPVLREAMQEVLIRLYPTARALFAQTAG